MNILILFAIITAAPVTFPIVDTGQTPCYDSRGPIPAPAACKPFYGQDAQYNGRTPSYTDNKDGTVTDNVTGLVWQQAVSPKMTWDEAVAGAAAFRLAGRSDWRLPTIKELYSLILFVGTDPPPQSQSSQGLRPFLDTDAFAFRYGDLDAGERIIDAQYWSATRYVSTTMNGNPTAFGVNFADGRIKGYPIGPVGPPGRQTVKKAFVRYVRGNAEYGKNVFVDNKDGTVTDTATGLMWTREDSGSPMDWEHALQYAEGLKVAGHEDWRLPNAKELQSIVDYTRAPRTHQSPAIDPVFITTRIKDEGGGTNYPCYWTGTTHSPDRHGAGFAVCVAFGEALGFMHMPPWSDETRLLDVHGAGAQRCDLKAGDPASLPRGMGPQGDVMRIYNHVRCVRDAK